MSGSQKTDSIFQEFEALQKQETLTPLEILQRADARHHLHPFTDLGVFKQAPPFLIESAQGCVITGQGVQLLDAMAGLGCVNIGYGREEMAEEAAAATRELNYYHSFAGVGSGPSAALAEKIAGHLPAGFERVFFANSGSGANETVLKLIRAYWKAKGAPEKRHIISRDRAYHGSTMATAALNGRPDMREPFDLDTSDISFVEAPFWYRNGGSLSAAEYGRAAAARLEDHILRIGPEKVAAIFAEPVQGTGGAIIPPETYFPAVQEIVKRYDILLVADEVLTGMGRTGHWTACETMGIKPDFITLSKGVSSAYAPISAACAHEDILNLLEAKMGVFQHGFTTSAHPVACRMALKNIEILERDCLIERIQREVGPYFKRSMDTLGAHPLVGEVRSMGMIYGIEICKNQQTREQFPIELQVDEHIGQACLMNGLIVRPTGNTLVLCPPFVISFEEIDYITNAVGKALDQVLAQLKEGGLL